MLVRIEYNYARETSGPGSRFGGKRLEIVQAEAVLRRIRERLVEHKVNDYGRSYVPWNVIDVLLDPPSWPALLADRAPSEEVFGG